MHFSAGAICYARLRARGCRRRQLAPVYVPRLQNSIPKYHRLLRHNMSCCGGAAGGDFGMDFCSFTTTRRGSRGSF